MSLTLSKVRGPSAEGHSWFTIYEALADNSYPTGGWSLKQSDVGFAATTDPEFDVQIRPNSGYSFEYDYTNQKLIARVPVAVYTATFDPASLAATTSRDDAITVTGVAATDVIVRVDPPPAIIASEVVQESRVTGTNTITTRLTNPSAGAVDVLTGTWTFYVAAANGAAHEVPNATDLSAILTKVRIVAKGKFRG